MPCDWKTKGNCETFLINCSKLWQRSQVAPCRQKCKHTFVFAEPRQACCCAKLPCIAQLSNFPIVQCLKLPRFQLAGVKWICKENQKSRLFFRSDFNGLGPCLWLCSEFKEAFEVQSGLFKPAPKSLLFKVSINYTDGRWLKRCLVLWDVFYILIKAYILCSVCFLQSNSLYHNLAKGKSYNTFNLFLNAEYCSPLLNATGDCIWKDVIVNRISEDRPNSLQVLLSLQMIIVVVGMVTNENDYDDDSHM